MHAPKCPIGGEQKCTAQKEHEENWGTYNRHLGPRKGGNDQTGIGACTALIGQAGHTRKRKERGKKKEASSGGYSWGQTTRTEGKPPPPPPPGQLTMNSHSPLPPRKQPIRASAGGAKHPRRRRAYPSEDEATGGIPKGPPPAKASGARRRLNPDG